MKEVCILNDLKCDHIVKVGGFCAQPVAVMLEYIFFDFQPFGIHSDRVSSLKEYLDFICSGNHIIQLSSLQIKIAQDISAATAFLHRKYIVHRDIKPANILVSNRHYCHLKDPAQIEEIWLREGIICKLANFGESRSKLNQTAMLQHTRTTNFERRTVVYNPHEMLTANRESASFSLEDLKHADIWSLGMVICSSSLTRN
jgi:serine/threonine protein kinase